MCSAISLASMSTEVVFCHLGELFVGCGFFDFEAFADELQQLQGLCGFFFRQEIDLEVEMGAGIGFAGHAVLLHEDEGAEQDAFDRNDHGEQDEGVRIKGSDDGQDAGIDEEPEQEPNGVEADEKHGAGKVCDEVGDALGKGAVTFGVPLERGDGADVGLQGGAGLGTGLRGFHCANRCRGGEQGLRAAGERQREQHRHRVCCVRWQMDCAVERQNVAQTRGLSGSWLARRARGYRGFGTGLENEAAPKNAEDGEDGDGDEGADDATDLAAGEDAEDGGEGIDFERFAHDAGSVEVILQNAPGAEKEEEP